MQPTDVKMAPDRATVLTKATIAAADLLGLKDVDLATIIGVSGPTVSRYKSGRVEIDPDKKTGELALLLVRVFRSLDPLVGTNDDARKAWMRSVNTRLGGEPATLIRKPEGLVRTLAYLDGLRAPV